MCDVCHYTIPRNNRELQRRIKHYIKNIHYTIPRNNRELQQQDTIMCDVCHYTIPRNNRELQPGVFSTTLILIIPYQEIIGNYSRRPRLQTERGIIPYQEIIGNYSVQGVS